MVLLPVLLHKLNLRPQHLLLSLKPNLILEQVQVQELKLTPLLEWEASLECLACPEWLQEAVLLAWVV